MRFLAGGLRRGFFSSNRNDGRGRDNIYSFNLPEKDDAYIGWFLVEAERQNAGIGSQIFADVRAAMKSQGYDSLSLSMAKENEEVVKFWQKQGFAFTGEETPGERYTSAVMRRDI